MNGPDLAPRDLATLLDEANHHPWESVRAALMTVGNEPHPRVSWLAAHLLDTKREYWTLIAHAANTPVPPDDVDLTRLMAWEVGAARALADTTLTLSVTHADVPFTVAELLRLNARHTAWHAGQIAALTAGRQPA